MKKNRPLIYVLIAIFLGILLGSLIHKREDILSSTFYSVCDVLGQIFINFLLLIVVPLIASSIITGISQISNKDSFKKIGLRSFFLFISLNFLAILCGFLFVKAFNIPLIRSAQLVNFKELPPSFDSPIDHTSLVRIILQIIPSNILDAFSHNRMLSLIFFSLLFGYAIAKIEEGPKENLKSFWLGIFQAMVKITHVVMLFLPLGVFCLIVTQFGRVGMAFIRPLILFLSVVISCMIFFVVAILFPLIKLISKTSPLYHFKIMSSALATAFSTSSTSATMPITMQCLRKRKDVSTSIVNIVIPLASSLNLSASALFTYVSTIFISYAYNLTLSLSSNLIIIFLSLLASLGIAGIPSGGLVAIIVVLKSIGLPGEGIALILAVDRIIDMFRTTANVFTNSVSTLFVSKWEDKKFSKT